MEVDSSGRIQTLSNLIAIAEMFAALRSWGMFDLPRNIQTGFKKLCIYFGY